MNGNRMPISISHVFNSNEKDQNINYGYGWRLNLNQRIVPQTIGTTQYYVYIDEDGTKYYLKLGATQGVYEDESGINITMTIDSASTLERYKLKDKGGNQLSFTSTGYLYLIKDANGNTNTLQYNGTDLIKVTDSTGRYVTLERDPNTKYLTGIVDAALRRTSFDYTNNRLTKITYPDGKYSTYNYDANGNIASVINFDGYKLTYSYYGTAPYKVQKVQEGHTDGTTGGCLNFIYGYNTTTFTDQDGRAETYQFNFNGNTINIKDEDGSAQYYKYIEDGGNKNKISEQSKLQKTTINYLKNHNIETTGYWNHEYWSGATGNGSFATDAKYFGNQSIKIENTNSVGRHVYYQGTTLEKGKTYTLSGYIKTVSISSPSAKGTNLFVTYQDKNGVWQAIEGQFVTGTNDWDRYEITFTLPSDAMSTTVNACVGIREGTGIAYFDALQLESGSIANRYNLVENADFKYGTGVPTFWTKGSETDSADTLTTVSNQPKSLNNSVFKFTGTAASRKYIYQTISVSGKAGDSIIFGGWVKGDSVPLVSGRRMALDMGIKRADGTTQWKSVYFNEDSLDWQYVSDAAVADQDFTSITIYACYYYNANTAYFDGMQLYKEEFSQSYTYDSNGNVVSTKDLQKQTSSFEYSNNDMTKMVDPKGNNFKYNYDTKHNILDATSAENVVYAFTYDSYGNPLTSKIRDAAGTMVINSNATYTTDGNYIKEVEDSEGNKVSYSYNSVKGTLDKLTDAKGSETNYVYDDLDRLKSVSKSVDGNTITNSYGYENDKIKTINHNGFNYIFGYDSFGNNTTVSVGTQKLIENTYNLVSGKLLYSTYGNGHKVSYDYDDLDRVTAEKYNDIVKFKYEYDSSGNLGYHEDLVNGVNYRYIYDLSDRLVKIAESNGNTLKYAFDANSNRNKVTEKVNGTEYITSYEFDKDNRPTKVILSSGSYVTLGYDSIGRLNNSVLTIGSNKFTTTYSYKAGINASTTNKVESITNGTNTISYTYDKNGNIETITEGLKTVKYYYNPLNELIREDNKFLDKTIVYSYDEGGNILNKTEYAYTTSDTLGDALKTVTYNYGDTNWKDKLTSITVKIGTDNPQTYDITYDAIGNPLTYNGYTYTWEMGRQLAGISGNGINASFKYDDDGIRTEKTVGTVTTKYHLVGDKVTLEDNGQDTIYYSYDSSDNLIAMKLNGVEYYYIRNAQGDIIGLLDSTGTQVVSYTYDSWGKLISIDGSLKDSVGVKNPYRYRGYRYDTETGLYYLQSRYYNPEWGRFINADAIAGSKGVLLSHNVFAYCLNNPVNQLDEGGFFAPAVVYAAYMYACAVASSSDTQRDLQLISMDLAEGDYVAAALDLIGVLVPGGTGFGQLSKPGRKIVGKLLRWIDRALEGIAKSSSAVLRKNMIKAGLKVPKFANAAHHIVAGNAPGAKEARMILKKFGIGINDATNGVFLSQTYHNALHTNAYYKKVNTLLKGSDSREEAIEILNYIARQLQKGKF